MQKRILISIFLVFSFQFSFSQEETITPVHIIKLDVFKSTFSQLHLDYERYNGKRGAVEIGLSLFYRNPVFAAINQGISKNGNLNLYAFQYFGYGLELRRKFYFPKHHANRYLAPELTFKYKYFNDREILLDGERNSSYAVWNTVSRQMYTVGINGIAGFTTNLHRHCILDLNAGMGVGYVDASTQVSDYGRYSYYYPRHLAGHDTYAVFQLQLSAKFCFGFNGKTKSAK